MPKNVASFPGHRPAFRRLLYRTASDEKLGNGLGTRLQKTLTSPLYTHPSHTHTHTHTNIPCEGPRLR